MRYLLSLIVGMLISIIVFTSIAYLAIAFNMNPYSDFHKVNIDVAKGNITTHTMDLFYDLARRVLIINICEVFPLIGFITGVGVALITQKKTIILAIASTLPLTFLFYSVSMDFVYTLASLMVSVILGTMAVKYMKSHRAEGYIPK